MASEKDMITLTGVENNIYYFNCNGMPYVFRSDVSKEFILKMFKHKPWKAFNLVKRTGERVIDLEDVVYNLEHRDSQRYHICSRVICYTGINPKTKGPSIILEATAPNNAVVRINLSQREELEKLRWVLEKIL